MDLSINSIGLAPFGLPCILIVFAQMAILNEMYDLILQVKAQSYHVTTDILIEEQFVFVPLQDFAPPNSVAIRPPHYRS